MKNILILAMALAGSMSAATIGLWSTGVCSGLNNGEGGCTPGTLLTFGQNDNNYQYVSRADGGTTGNDSSLTESATGAVSTYLANGVGASEWIAPDPFSATELIGTYEVDTTFSLTGFVASSLVLSLDVAADNDVNVDLNGHLILSCQTGGSSCFTAFTSNHDLTVGASGFALAGLNTLEFIVTNEDSGSPTGLRVQASGTATASSVPEPGTYGLLGLGLAGIGLLRRRIA